MQNPQTVPPGEVYLIRLPDDGLRGKQGVTKDEIRQIGVVQRHRAQEQRFFLGPNPQGHPAVVFNRYSGHDRPLSVMYTFK
jgi:hypothetical protein